MSLLPADTPRCVNEECDALLDGEQDACQECGTPFCACTTKAGQPLYPCNHHNPR